MSRKNCAEVRCGYLNCHSNKCDCFEIVTKRTYQRKDHIARVFMRLVLSLFLFPCCCRELFIWNASHACLCGLFWEGFSTIKTQNALVRGRSHRTGGRQRLSLLSLTLSLSRSLALLLSLASSYVLQTLQWSSLSELIQFTGYICVGVSAQNSVLDTSLAHFEGTITTP